MGSIMAVLNHPSAADTAHLMQPLHHPSANKSLRIWVEGRGATIKDAEGREYIDGLAGLMERQHRPRPA